MTFTDNTRRYIYFTENEIAVSWFFMTGMNLRQIAEWTGLKEKSVNDYKKRVMRKVGVKNNNELKMWFLQNRLVYNNHCAELSILRRSTLNKLSN
ncbi:helix-turn-helix transcriptional regulator [Pantoea sp. EEL5]|uniref:helix-turn-helix transcriptional regulator n=1 Tax=Pantoea sp. EEL5 TaxID=3416806 RepID=UPI003CF9282D